MTLSLIWQPKAGGVIYYPPDDFTGVPIGPMYRAIVLAPAYTGRAIGRGWTARQINRWETKYGKAWEGEHWPLQ